jgi:hypothetical protein
MSRGETRTLNLSARVVPSLNSDRLGLQANVVLVFGDQLETAVAGQG